MRTIIRTILVVFVLALVVGAFAPNASAQFQNTTGWDRKTNMTINAAWKMPGITLPAGTYVFRLLSLGQGGGATRSVVLIFNADETKVLATILGLTAYRTGSKDELVFHFGEANKGEPEPLLHWFSPGSSSGLEFVYSK